MSIQEDDGSPAGAGPGTHWPALDDVAQERMRQRLKKGFSEIHDDQHKDGSMALAAACYAMFAFVSDSQRKRTDIPGGLTVSGKDILGFSAFLEIWPWDRKWWKPKDRRRDLVRAGALIIAEIERLDRAKATKGPPLRPNSKS